MTFLWWKEVQDNAFIGADDKVEDRVGFVREGGSKEGANDDGGERDGRHMSKKVGTSWC